MVNVSLAGSIPGLAQWVKDPSIAVSCGVGCRHGSDPELLLLWRRPVAMAPIRPLVWEVPYAVGAAPAKAKRPKKKKFQFIVDFASCSNNLRTQT